MPASGAGPRAQDLGGVDLKRREIGAGPACRDDLVGAHQYPARTTHPIAFAHFASGIATAIQSENLHAVAGVIDDTIEGDRLALFFEDQQAVARRREIGPQAGSLAARRIDDRGFARPRAHLRALAATFATSQRNQGPSR